MNKDKPYNKLPKEPEHIYQAFKTYKEIGDDRTLSKLARIYVLQNNENQNSNLFGEITTENILKKLAKWSISNTYGYTWAERLSAFYEDELQRKEIEERKQFEALKKSSNRQTYSTSAKFSQAIQPYLEEIIQKPFEYVPIYDKSGNIIGSKKIVNPLTKDLRNFAATFELAKKFERESLGLQEGQFAIFYGNSNDKISKYNINLLNKEEQIIFYELLERITIHEP